MKNRIVLLNRKKNDRRKMDRWMRKLLKTDMMKDIVRAYDKNRIMLDDYKNERPSYEYRVAMGGGAWESVINVVIGVSWWSQRLAVSALA